MINNTSSKKQVKCFGCGEADHILPKCPYKKNNKNKTEAENKLISGSNAESDSAGVSTNQWSVNPLRDMGHIRPIAFSSNFQKNLSVKGLFKKMKFL